jgi:hypothetical protein
MKVRVAIIAAIVTASLCLYACKKEGYEKAKDAQQGLVYFQDTRTGLCFAFLEEGFGETKRMGLAHVPCKAIEGHAETTIQPVVSCDAGTPVQPIVWLSEIPPLQLWEPIGPI